MADVCIVLDVSDLHTAVNQRTADPVCHEIGAQIPDMGIAIHGGTARVHLDNPRRGGLNLFNLFGEGVVDAEQRDLFYLRFHAGFRVF